jgi:alpha-mannosidase
LRVTFGADGALMSVYDKEQQREVLAAGSRANVLTLYPDSGDAWDFPLYYRDLPTRTCTLVESYVECDGPRTSVIRHYRIGASTIEQRISLTADSRRLDFATRVDWHESQQMLRTSFPLAIHSPVATCDIQFGTLQRPTHTNTSWDHARYEICAQKWLDLSQEDYGVALLNDSKYGHAVTESSIDLHLLRSPNSPDPQADQGQHEFTYALYPHSGNHRAGKVARAGYELNIPLRVLPLEQESGGRFPAQTSFLRVDAENVVIETIKKAEDDEHMIVRLYEGQGACTTTSLHFAFPVAAVHLVNLLEEPIQECCLRGQNVEMTLTPFEIQTLKIALK